MRSLFSRRLALTWILVAAGMAGGITAWGADGLLPEFTVETAQQYLRAASQEFVKEANGEPQALLLQARLERDVGQHAEAERLARQAMQRAPDQATIHSFLADLFIRQDRLKEAEDALRKTVSLDPATPGADRRLGMVLDRLGHREEARTTFELAVAMAPGDATARLLLGRLLLDDGKTSEAATHLEQACKIDPTLANAFYALFQAQTRLGQDAAAKQTLATFQQLKRVERADLDAESAGADNPRAMRGLAVQFYAEAARILEQQGRLDAASAHLHRGISIDPQNEESRVQLAALCMRNGPSQDARKAFEELVRLWPTNTTYRVNLGTLLLQLRKFPEAASELERVLELDPKQPEALNNLARYHLGQGRDRVAALSLCRRLVSVQPTAADRKSVV